MSPRRRWAGGLGVLVSAGAIAWVAGSAVQQPTVRPDAALSPDPDQAGDRSADRDAAASAPVPAKAAPVAPPPPVTQDTPMAERIAVLGVLNKRDGLSRDVSLHPGQAARFGDLIVRLRACDTTADWEPEKLTGAFVQADVHGTDGAWRRVFSGWLYKESPSLNAVQSPLYDVWPKSCTMRHPETGPDTVSAGSVASSGAVPRRSSAKKSADEAAPGEAADPSPSALSNSAT
jgi:hypothetical protein